MRFTKIIDAYVSMQKVLDFSTTLCIALAYEEKEEHGNATIYNKLFTINKDENQPISYYYKA